ncbi:hypothetical protein FRB98_002615 [Tulasnella sp. 332]|nr:hypothetical protein FRB98_002615 [Tulasnella sp. 332]
MSTPTAGTSHSESDPPAFGSRYLTDESLVFQQNAWDHVSPPDDQGEKIDQAIARQRNAPVPEDKKVTYNAKPAYFWDIFYRNNQSNFFKDRKWLQREFPQLEDIIFDGAGPKSILEIGCGAGNAVFPLLASNKNPYLRINACDYSKHAVRVVRSNPLYKNPPCGSIHSSIWDLSSQTLPEGLKPCSVDIIIMVFVLSALHPDEWPQAIANVYTLLKPGGLVLLRDYGRHDLAQLRFKEGRLLEDNFYVRGDGTRVYFFEPNQLAKLFTGLDVEMDVDGAKIRTLKIVQQEERANGASPAPPTIRSVVPLTSVTLDTPFSSHSPRSDMEGERGQVGMSLAKLRISEEASVTPPTSALTPTDSVLVVTSGTELDARAAFFATPVPEPPCDLARSSSLGSLPPHPLFTTVQLGVDRRLIVNRKRQLKMYRVWLQGEFRKNNAGMEDHPLS